MPAAIIRPENRALVADRPQPLAVARAEDRHKVVLWTASIPASMQPPDRL
jgi:hypothetical protein